MGIFVLENSASACAIPRWMSCQRSKAMVPEPHPTFNTEPMWYFSMASRNLTLSNVWGCCSPHGLPKAITPKSIWVICPTFCSKLSFATISSMALSSVRMLSAVGFSVADCWAMPLFGRFKAKTAINGVRNRKWR